MKSLWLWIVVAVVVIGGAYWWWQTYYPSEAVEYGTTSEVPAGTQSAPMSATVVYDGTSFSPSEVTIKKGGTVTFTSTGANMWIASGPHPAHTGYDATVLAVHCAVGAIPSFDQCKAGSSYSFTFDKTGTWPYHNHLNATVFGKVIVVE